MCILNPNLDSFLIRFQFIKSIIQQIWFKNRRAKWRKRDRLHSVFDGKHSFNSPLNGILPTSLVDDTLYNPYNTSWAHKFAANSLTPRDFWSSNFTNNLGTSNFATTLSSTANFNTSSLTTSLSNNLASNLAINNNNGFVNLGSQVGAFGKLNGNASAANNNSSSNGSANGNGVSSNHLANVTGTTVVSNTAALFNSVGGGYSSYTPPDIKPVVDHSALNANGTNSDNGSSGGGSAI